MCKAAFLTALSILFLIFFAGCKDEDPASPEIKTYKMDPAHYVKVALDNLSGDYKANITWGHSFDEDKSDFTGYAISTYEVNENGLRVNPSAIVDSSIILKTFGTTVYSIGILEKNKYYKTSVYSISFNTVFSAPSESETYNTFEIAPPSGLIVELSPDNVWAGIRWNRSPDESRADFQGYKHATYAVTPDGQKIAKVDSAWLNKLVNSSLLSWLEAGHRYKTYLWGHQENGAVSVICESHIYGVAISNKNAEINAMSADTAARSGYGWSNSGIGKKYSYSHANSSLMDMICRKEGNSYMLYSPDGLSSPLAGARSTKFVKLDSDKWLNSYINLEPYYNSISIEKDDVILLKNSDDYYIKMKITEIIITASGLVTIKFQSKFQNIKGLRVI